MQRLKLATARKTTHNAILWQLSHILFCPLFIKYFLYYDYHLLLLFVDIRINFILCLKTAGAYPSKIIFFARKKNHIRARTLTRNVWSSSVFSVRCPVPNWVIILSEWECKGTLRVYALMLPRILKTLGFNNNNNLTCYCRFKSNCYTFN